MIKEKEKKSVLGGSSHKRIFSEAMKRAHEVYEADEDDYEYDEYGNALPMSAAEEDVDATMVDESETNKRAAATSSAAAIPGDPLSLTRCWEAALYDYKVCYSPLDVLQRTDWAVEFAHPSSFEPMQHRPKTAAEKAAFAPLFVSSRRLPACTHHRLETGGTALTIRQPPRRQQTERANNVRNLPRSVQKQVLSRS